METKQFFSKNADGSRSTYVGSRKDFDRWLKETGAKETKTSPPADDPAVSAATGGATPTVMELQSQIDNMTKLAFATARATTLIEEMQSQIDALTRLALGKELSTDRAMLENILGIQAKGK